MIPATFEVQNNAVLVTAANGTIIAGAAAGARVLGLSNPPSHLREIAPWLSRLNQVDEHLFAGDDLVISAVALPHGGAMLDIARRGEKHDTYRSIFERSVYGIYRDTIDGRPLRCNPALARLNGYDSEQQYLDALGARPANWYVDSSRAREFRRLLDAEGRVHDMVSEVYRHRSGEKFWITENAWFVRDTDGNPIFVEGTIQDATDRIASQAAIHQQAMTDALTGAASRYCFFNRLKAETQTDSSGAVLYIIDLDRFKEVNDMLGHTAGDIVLKTMAQRLTKIAGHTGFLARLGGDEFAILDTGSHGYINADHTGAAIVKAMRQPIVVEGRSIPVGGSVGAAIFPAHAGNGEELLSHADLALYQVKSTGKNGFRIFDHDLKADRDRRKALENDLRKAIAGNQLDLFYQPLVDAHVETIMGFEALMRWRHPVRGLMAPGLFIAIAEEAGLMSALGNWAIQRACMQAAAWPDHVAVSVNVSPTQFRSPGIVAAVREALADSGLSPSRLILEVTESAILPGENLAAIIMDDLQRLGVQLALDDFGTGYSSLSYLQRFRFSKVKIDRSFVADISHEHANQAIIRAVMMLCRELDIDVVTEGIETREQADLIKGLGGHYFQGYLFGKPMPYAEAVGHLAANQLRRAAPSVEPEPISQVA